MRVVHEVADAPEGGSRVTERAVLREPLARLWSLLLGRQLQRDMAASAQASARAAAEKSGDGCVGNYSPATLAPASSMLKVCSKTGPVNMCIV